MQNATFKVQNVLIPVCHSEEHRDEESVPPYLRLGERILRLRFAPLRMTTEIIYASDNTKNRSAFCTMRSALCVLHSALCVPPTGRECKMVVTLLCHSEEHRDEESVFPFFLL